jgi:hypothetical protein
MATVIQMGACSLNSFACREDSRSCPEKYGANWVTSATHLIDYREAVVLLVEGSSDPRKHDEANAVGEGRSSCPTYAWPLFFVQYT